MEKNIVVIDLEKYENLIKEIENQKSKISNLEQELEKKISKNEKVDNAIYKKIFDDKHWDLKQIVDDREHNFDYYSKRIKKDFNEYGYEDENYIKESIELMIYDRKQEIENENEK